MEDGTKTDAMIARLEREVAERDAFIQGTVANAQDAERDLTGSEQELVTEARKRIEVAEEQMDTLNAAKVRTEAARRKAADVQNELARMRRGVDAGDIEYRSAGDYALDLYKAHLNDRAAQERLEFYHRAAAHVKSADTLGIIPDPIVGDVLNFIDASRPLVGVLGPRPLPSNTWYRPLVSQGTSVAVQGTAGAAGDEKAELVSQKLTISRVSASAVTYGGYVNVSRQDIDFSNGASLQAIIDDLASRYAIQTEAALGTAMDASTSTNVGYGPTPTASTIRSALWTAASTIYTATGGRGRVILALSAGRMPVFGNLFAPVTSVAAQGEGMTASDFNAGPVGNISGIPVYFSPGLGTNKAFLFSTAAIEVYEQRVGALQVTEPSVLGVQVAYAGYFTPLLLVNNGVIELTAT